MIKRSGTIDAKRGRFFPLAEWSKEDVMAYIRQRRRKVGAESARLGFSFRSLMGKDLVRIQKFYPADYAKIRRWFPLVDASILSYRMKGGEHGEAQ